MHPVPSNPVLSCAEAGAWEHGILKDEAAEWSAMQQAGAKVAYAILADYQEIGGLPERQLTRLRRDRIGFVFQAYNLLPVLSAVDNITLPLDIAGRRPDQQWLNTVVDTVGLRDRLRHRPSELSGGQQQRVAIARALVSRPEIVFADEPTGNLDSRASAEVLGLLRRSVRDYGQTIVMVTHDPVAACYAEKVVFLADGQIVGALEQPTPESVLDYMKNLGE